MQPDRFSVEDVPRPEPGENEVLCKVHAVAICGTDPHIIHGDYPGLLAEGVSVRPRARVGGEVVEVGPGAERFGWQIGTRVAGTSHAGCGFCRKCVEGRYNVCENYGDEAVHRQYGHYTQGSYAEYVVHSIASVFPIPDSLG